MDSTPLTAPSTVPPTSDSTSAHPTMPRLTEIPITDDNSRIEELHESVCDQISVCLLFATSTEVIMLDVKSLAFASNSVFSSI